MDSMIDTLIAEQRAAKEQPAPAAPVRQRADEVTAEIMAAAEDKTPEPPPSAEPVGDAEPVRDAEPVPEASTVQSADPKNPDGIWAMASVAAEAMARKKKASRRRFRIRLISRGGEPVDGIPAVTEIGTAVPLTTVESFGAPMGEEEPIGTLRPQDFFIADLRNEELASEVGEEYVSRNQIETITNGYCERKQHLRCRFFLSLFLSAFVLLFENLPLFGVDVPTLIGISPRIAVLLDIGLLLAAGLLVADHIGDAVSELFAWQFGAKAITLLSVGVALLLLIIHLILGVAAGLCALPAVLAVAMLLGFELLRVCDEEKTFLHLCESGDKLAAEELPSIYATEESLALGRKLRNVVRIKKVGFVTGFFARTQKKREDYRLHTVLSLSVLGVLVLGTALYAIIAPTAGADAILAFASWLAAPLSLSIFFAARRLPFHRLVEEADAHSTAVLGESSAEEYADIDAIAFEDVEAYPSRKVHVRKIKMYADSRLDEVLYYMASVFSVLGGPLDGVFRVSASELGISDDVALISTGRDGFEASVDGVPVKVGKWGYFPSEAVSPYCDSEDVYEEDCGNISIMYAAVDGVINAKFYIEYNLSQRFERDAQHLQREGVQTVVRSFDPNIGDALLATTVHRPGFRIRAVKKKPEQLYDFAEARVDSGLVTGAGSRDLLQVLFHCQSYRKVTRAMRICKMIATPLSVVAGLLLSLLGAVGGFHSVYGAALGLFWLIPVFLTSGIYFKKER